MRLVAIDKSGQWWTGSTADDVAEYLRAYEAGGYKVDEVKVASCGVCTRSEGFRLRVDAEEGFVERTCASCGAQTVMLGGGFVLARRNIAVAPGQGTNADWPCVSVVQP